MPDSKRKGPIRAIAAANPNDVAKAPQIPTDPNPDPNPKPPSGGSTSGASGSFKGDVSDVVKTAYNVIADNIERTRNAAEKFRQGDYQLGNVPDDLDRMLEGVSDLSRKLNRAAFEVFKMVVLDLAVARSDRNRAVSDAAVGPSATGVSPAPTSMDSGAMPLTLRFRGDAEPLTGRLTATPSTALLRRPGNGIGPGEIKVGPFTKQGETSDGSFGPVAFDFDLAQGVLVAEVTATPSATPGWYSALVYVPGEDAPPLGRLDVRLDEKKAESGTVSAEAAQPETAV
ncbi:MAG TPA: hypothetical protein VGF71_07350 [Caulobacteraceae bacterium]|jgi:hypothetical protein